MENIKLLKRQAYRKTNSYALRRIMKRFRYIIMFETGIYKTIKKILIWINRKIE